MNILPKKKWHVRTKENVARVRRDKKLAAEEENRINERALIAEREFKLNILRKNAQDRISASFAPSCSKSIKASEKHTMVDSSGHINLFVEMENEELKNLGSCNKEYDEEKRKEREEYEKKVGILQYLGQGSNELEKKATWYEQIPVNRVNSGKKILNESSGLLKRDTMKIKDRKEDAKKMNDNKKSSKSRDRNRSSYSKDRKMKDKKHRRSLSPFNDDVGSKKVSLKKMTTLEELRMERVKREEMERKKTENLLSSEKISAKRESKQESKYNSQFNPQLARQNLK